MVTALLSRPVTRIVVAMHNKNAPCARGGYGKRLTAQESCNALIFQGFPYC